MDSQSNSTAGQYAQLRDLGTASVSPTAFVLSDDIQLVTIGREANCQITINQNVVSRLHARIERAERGFLLHDNSSANGTFVHGLRIKEPYPLKDGDQIGLGSPTSQLRFEDPNATYRPTERLWYNEYFMLFFFRNQPLPLPASQFSLLMHLYRHVGTLCSRESCAQVLWSRTYDAKIDAAALDQAVTSLRSRLREIDPEADVIKTRRGQGYVLELEKE